MKYAVLMIPPINQERRFINLGDGFQMEAFLQTYESMGISRDEVIKIGINEVADYDGEPVILPINVNLSLNWVVNIFPLPPNIYPVFIGFSYFAATKLSDNMLDYLKIYQPIGCRDEFTLNLMRQNGIQAYLFGCITATLDRIDLKGNKIILADAAPVVEEKCYSVFGRENCISISHIVPSDAVNDNQVFYDKTLEYLEWYKKEAKLVVTARIHSMSPCMAMGIPVIPIVENISPRMAWIDKFLSIYTVEDVDKVDWSGGGQRVDYEDVKRAMRNIAIKRIRESYDKYAEIADLDYFYKDRKKACYGSKYLSELKKLEQTKLEHMRFAIWGCGQIGMNFCDVMKEHYPHSELVMPVDTFCTGDFKGKTICGPDDVKGLDKDIFVFITSYCGRHDIKSYLDNIGKKEGVHYMDVSSTSG